MMASLGLLSADVAASCQSLLMDVVHDCSVHNLKIKVVDAPFNNEPLW